MISKKDKFYKQFLSKNVVVQEERVLIWSFKESWQKNTCLFLVSTFNPTTIETVSNRYRVKS